MQTLALLGATGSIGEQTLDVISRHPERYRLFAVTANTRWQPLAEICLRHRPAVAVMADPVAADALRNHLRDAGSDTEVLAGEDSLEQVAAEADTTVAAIVGAAGVRPTLAAVKAGKRVLLANKEALVVTGQLFMDAVARHEATLLPVDSEHSAIFQCLPGGDDPLAGVKKLCLTASGGPFRTFSAEQLGAVTAAQAVRHPNWDMGPKISVDSATLMNKGLELIEASWLFGLPGERIDVVVHPQSVVHSMVEYLDGSVLAQLGTPDMKTPIAVALAWPERIASGAQALDFTRMGELSFEAPDVQRFPCLALARQALEAGGTATAVLNAANEEAVAAFLEGRIGFMEIAELVNRALESVLAPRCRNIDDVMDIDRAARRYVAACLSSRDE
ncbi:MAG: 1-deoxy-D-xylulose-5-phosphate reductoisomerase [Alcanivoracaceae bacterium]|nr:1-deoxy-D-xylulose-5-phosphate reductoisomerase [Alcanivoracaceae bacterium]